MPPLEAELIRAEMLAELNGARVAREYERWLERELARLETEVALDSFASLLFESYDLERDRSP